MNKLENVIEILKTEGLKNDQIGEFIANINSMVAQKVHLEIMSALTEEDLAEIEKAKEEEVNLTINQLYKERTGQDAEEIGDQALDNFVETFVADYKRRKNP